jgi:hypothetical protein
MAETFGQTTKLPLPSDLQPNFIWGCKFTSGSAGDLASMTVYLKNMGSPANVKLAMYDSSLNKLANSETEEKNIPTVTDAWVTFNFPTSPSVAASTIYWLCWWVAGDAFTGRKGVGATDQVLYQYLTYNGWPATISPPGYTDEESSIYATYEEVPPPKKTLVQAALISIPPLIVLPTLREILRLTGGC